MIDRVRIIDHVEGYGSVVKTPVYQKVFDEYTMRQNRTHEDKVHSFLLPLLKDCQHGPFKSVLDVGCGVGMMVKTLLDLDYDAYGVDLASSVPYWAKNDLPRDRFFITGPDTLSLPFRDGSIDAVFSLGVIEHVGTTNGHSDRRPDYHDVRKQWLTEVFRVVKPGGCMIIGGPNRNFPLDTHGPDSRASALESWLYKVFHISIHRTWGEHFLWGFGDFERYMAGVPCELRGLSMRNYHKDMNNVPKPFVSLFRFYIDNLPKGLLRTGFNPWAIALIRKK